MESQEVSISTPRILAQSLHSFNDPHEISGTALEPDLLDVGRDTGFAALTLLLNCSMFSGEVPTSIPFILAQSLQSFIEAHENSLSDFVGAFLDEGRDCGLAALAQLAHCSMESHEVSTSIFLASAQSLQKAMEVQEGSAIDFVGAFLKDGLDGGLAALAQLSHWSIESQEFPAPIPCILAQSLHASTEAHERSANDLFPTFLDCES
jgi:hypothetical protein